AYGGAPDGGTTPRRSSGSPSYGTPGRPPAGNPPPNPGGGSTSTTTCPSCSAWTGHFATAANPKANEPASTNPRPSPATTRHQRAGGTDQPGRPSILALMPKSVHPIVVHQNWLYEQLDVKAYADRARAQI